MKACQHARMYTYSKVGLAWPSPGNCCVLSMAAPEPSGTTETTVPRNWSLEVQFGWKWIYFSIGVWAPYPNLWRWTHHGLSWFPINNPSPTAKSHGRRRLGFPHSSGDTATSWVYHGGYFHEVINIINVGPKKTLVCIRYSLVFSLFPQFENIRGPEGDLETSSFFGEILF